MLDLSAFISFVCMPLGILNDETITFKLFKKDILLVIELDFNVTMIISSSWIILTQVLGILI